jgi:hypothetical protein
MMMIYVIKITNMNTHKVKDSYGKTVRCFNTYKEASNYKFAYGNSNWQII